jgi:hypothetical protein
MEGIKAFFRGEPVAVSAVIAAGITCAAAFGFALTAPQVVAVMAVVTAISALFARAKVSPVE